MTQVLGIRFFKGTAEQAVNEGLKGGLIVAPSAPVLAAMTHNPANREALIRADMALPDSGFMTLIWNRISRDRLRRISGLEFLIRLLKAPELKEPGALFWVMPSEEERAANLAFLKSEGFPTTPEDCHVAPVYDRQNVDDPDLVKSIDERKPKHVVVCLGGGVQEQLGLYLRSRLKGRPSIYCLGAAIGFLSGNQTGIPGWADACYLGWLFRCVSRPTRFIPRYWKAAKLLFLILKHRDRLPGGVLETSGPAGGGAEGEH